MSCSPTRGSSLAEDQSLYALADSVRKRVLECRNNDLERNISPDAPSVATNERLAQALTEGLLAANDVTDDDLLDLLGLLFSLRPSRPATVAGELALHIFLVPKKN
jgi:hypothetical protein